MGVLGAGQKVYVEKVYVLLPSPINEGTTLTTVFPVSCY